MGKITGFLEHERALAEKVAPKERISNYKELVKPADDELINQQAARCMDCGIPFCHSGCPLGNKIPDFNDAVYERDWEKAYTILKSTNNFPEFTGRICPAPCEGSCVLGINKEPVAIELIEKEIAERAFETGLEKVRIPEKRSDKKIAIIGSGPAGLAAADMLNQMGHTVTVFEKDEKPGGLLRFGIPDFKLEKRVVERRIDLLEQEGITFKNNVCVGENLSWCELDKSFDATVLCLGSTIPRDIGAIGREVNGVHFAMEFLGQQNRRNAEIKFDEPSISAKGKNVVVIGGGDTGSDCIGTCNRQCAKSITQIEILDKPPLTRSNENPWPEWPLILRTSSSHEEGSDRKWALLTKEFMVKNNKLVGINVSEVHFENGTMVEKENSDDIIKCDLVLIAAGFVGPKKSGLIEALKLDVNNRGNIATKGYQTNIDKIFAAGDARMGQSLVVSAIAEGRKVATAVDKYLN